MKLIDVSTKKHPNTFTMVDDADYEWLNQWKWYLSYTGGYVVRLTYAPGKPRVKIFMHREILKPPPGMMGDHRFGNRLDNRRENLRVCTSAENSRNRRTSNGRALPKGVCWPARDRRFRAKITVDGRDIYLGSFLTVTEAEAAYNAAAVKYHGEFASPTTESMQKERGES